jgi:hypothetical protein
MEGFAVLIGLADDAIHENDHPLLHRQQLGT